MKEIKQSVQQNNSLETPIDGVYDRIITNMPFSQNVSLDISKHYYDGLAKKSGDGVCILHCFKSVKKGGCMALIVPEGVLFKKTLLAVRKFLLENAKLELVISLPQGVFLPYTNVKTSILYFTNCHIPNENKEPICFYEVKNDGYTLDNHRRPIEENDLKYIDYIDFNNQNSQFKNNNFRKVEYEDIKENDYNLIANRYLQTDDLNSSRTTIIKEHTIEEEIDNVQKGIEHLEKAIKSLKKSIQTMEENIKIEETKLQELLLIKVNK